MENNDNIIMSRIAFERMQAKEETDNKWKNILILVLIVLLALSNALWLLYESQFETVTDEYSIEAEQDGDGVNIVSGGNVGYGTEGESTQTNNDKAAL